MALTDVDRGLLTRCLRQTPGAWEEFVSRFGGLLVHVVRHTAAARSVPLSKDVEEDVVADVMLELLSDDCAALRRFEGRSSLASYLTVVARRTAVRELSERRAAAAMGHVEGHAPPGLKSSPKAAHPPADGRIADKEQVERLLAALPDRDAEIVRRYHLQGESYREIAAGMNVPENSIGPALSRARQKLRDLGL
ncbi:RNA polymerase sigma factor [Alienimonas californiensis]|uniref:RNA polymerase sigma factor n=1 Tax=Alienimonas californiensis TaxID=2527989 RepID=A0A517PFD4_9PLAN|nr:sigma-70 family RNA polymerase sigma factor [Alienimonas californiensis]QDT18082.1 RNA polymerase sigma factor [Alienimonas californiensis]